MLFAVHLILFVVLFNGGAEAEKTGVKMDAQLFTSHKIDHNFREISSTTVIKGKISDLSGKGIPEKEIHFLVNNIEIGKTRTTKEGCFYFNKWNNEKLDSILKHPINPSLPIYIESRFYENDFMKISKYNHDIIWFTPLMGTPLTPKLISETTNSTYVIKTGESLTINMSIDWTYGPARLIDQSLSFNSLPCDISGIIKYNKPHSTKSPLYTITIYVDDDAMPGEHMVGISGKGIVQDVTSGQLIGNYHIDESIILKIIPS